jgi:hypothetical protein
MDHQETDTGEATRHEVPILIDGQRFEEPRETMTGEAIRHVPVPPIPADRDLWLDRDNGLDELIHDHTVVHLHPDMRFFTVPRVINPGASRC